MPCAMASRAGGADKFVQIQGNSGSGQLAAAPAAAPSSDSADEQRTVGGAGRTLASVLADSGLLTREAIHRATIVQTESGERLESVVTRLGLASEQALSEALAAASGLPLANSAQLKFANIGDHPLSGAFLRDIRAVPLSFDDAHVLVAVVDPFDPFVAQAFRFSYGRRVDRVVARASDIDAAIERISAQDADEPDVVESGLDSDDIERLRDLVSDAPAIRAVNRLIADAVDQRASDIHLEPGEDALLVRLRVDGMLRETQRLPAALKTSVIARIKVMAGLDIAERRLPQDGRLRLAVRGHDIDLRVATAPSIEGESVVLRILDRAGLALDLTALGFDDALAGQLREAIHKPHGIVLVTGPTGSGKTTTLYAALAELNRVERKLLTVEDPIEYRLSGVIQTQVHPAIGFTFASALRSFLRQDPDVIMVGEIRDSETARIAVQAALTGHMILSTLHTNTAAGAVTRLLDMGTEPFLLGSVLTGVLAQRLVRRLCMVCREPVATDKPLRKATGIKVDTIYRPRGCPSCSGTGYAGRVAVFEYLPVTDEIARLIVKNANTHQIEDAAHEAGHRSLVHDGYAKVAAGLTSVAEVLRVGSGE